MTTTFQTDSHFVLGSLHSSSGQPCQDYATSGQMESAAYAIVSDGCSSGGQTDVGARITALAMAEALRIQSKLHHHIGQAQIQALAAQQLAIMVATGHLLNLTPTDLLATCLVAYQSHQGGWAYLRGDGLVIWNTATGEQLAIRAEWSPDNPERAAPFYPAYAIGDTADFVGHYGGPDVMAYHLEHWRLAPGRPQCLSSQFQTVSEGLAGTFVTLPTDTQTVAVVSDGSCQIEDLDWQEAAKQLTSFKTTAGAFATRRLMRFVKANQVNGRRSLDDLALAVIRR